MQADRLGIRRPRNRAAPIDLESDTPSVGRWRLRIQDKTEQTYHVDWSTRQPVPQFEPWTAARATHQGRHIPGACEIVGLCAGMEPLRRRLNGMARGSEPRTDADVSILTTNGSATRNPPGFSTAQAKE